MSPQRFGRATVALTTAAMVVAALSSCAKSDRDNSTTTGGGGKSGNGGTFVFAASSDPVMLDPAFASDGETFRVARQMFEGLVGTKPGTADPAPLLAESWTNTPDGLAYTFTLKKGVKFHDGTDFNGEAVCANFERWYNWTGLNQNENISYYYNSLFKGFKQNDAGTTGQPVYKSCEAPSADQATIHLNAPFAAFVDAMSLPAFSMQSPTAMKKYNADNTEGTKDDPRFSPYATEHPTGTGPFKFESWQRGQSVKLTRNEDYWGKRANVEKVIVQTLSDGKARLQSLKSGEVDGYDLVAPGDVEGLKSAGFQVMQRDPFNVLYLGINQANPMLAKPEVRKAIAYALDKEAIVKQSLPAGTKVANEFMPSTVGGYTEDVTKYEYNPTKAKELLKQAGAEGMTVKFNYPTGVSRPYMPSPEDTYVAVKAQLEAVGIKVQDVPSKWSPDYLDKIQGSPDHDLHLLGWTGDYNSADNFVGVFFGDKKPEWGFDNPALFTALSDARKLPTADAQKPKYTEINKMISEFVPGVPLAHPAPSLAFSKKVAGYKPSPVQDEVWNEITVSK